MPWALVVGKDGLVMYKNIGGDMGKWHFECEDDANCELLMDFGLH